MRYILGTINEIGREVHVDAEFSDMVALLEYVEQCGHNWTSLVVIVLPAKEMNNEA